MKYTTEPFEVVPVAVSISEPEAVVIGDITYSQATAYNEQGTAIGILRRSISPVMVPDYENNAELLLMHLCDSRGIVVTGTIEE